MVEFQNNILYSDIVVQQKCVKKRGIKFLTWFKHFFSLFTLIGRSTFPAFFHFSFYSGFFYFLHFSFHFLFFFLFFSVFLFSFFSPFFRFLFILLFVCSSFSVFLFSLFSLILRIFVNSFSMFQSSQSIPNISASINSRNLMLTMAEETSTMWVLNKKSYPESTMNSNSRSKTKTIEERKQTKPNWTKLKESKFPREFMYFQKNKAQNFLFVVCNWREFLYVVDSLM